VQIDPAFKRELSSEEIGPPPADSNLMIVQPEFLPLIFLDGGRTGIEAVKRSGLLPAALERTAPLLSSWFASNHPMLTTKYGLYLTNSLSGFLAMVLQQGEKSYLDREFILWPLPEALSLKDVNSLADLASRLAKAYPQLSLKINLWEAQLYLKANFATLKAEHHLPLSYSPDDTDVKLKVNKVLPLSDDDLAKLNELMNLKINFSCDF
jgi:hypothetical protein